MEKIREVYDQCIWKELERSDATAVEVYHITLYPITLVFNIEPNMFT